MTADAENRLIALAVAGAIATCRATAPVSGLDPDDEDSPLSTLICNIKPEGHGGLHFDPVDGVWWTRDPMMGAGQLGSASRPSRRRPCAARCTASRCGSPSPTDPT